jgi:hypothetical protein
MHVEQISVVSRNSNWHFRESRFAPHYNSAVIGELARDVAHDEKMARMTAGYEK